MRILLKKIEFKFAAIKSTIYFLKIRNREMTDQTFDKFHVKNCFQ